MFSHNINKNKTVICIPLPQIITELRPLGLRLKVLIQACKKKIVYSYYGYVILLLYIIGIHIVYLQDFQSRQIHVEQRRRNHL